MSTISASTTTTTAYKVTADTTGTLVLQTGSTPTTAVTISSAQIVTFANPPVANGAGSVSSNTVFGSGSLTSNTTGNNNSVFGQASLSTNTTGAQNTAIGQGVLYYSNANYNTGVGGAALQNNTSGASNTGIGQSALFNNTTASNNTAVGYQAGYTTAAGNGANVFLGYQAGYTFNSSVDGNNTLVGERSGYSLTTGYQNTFLGSVAGYNVTTGYRNTIIGRYNGNQGGLDIRTTSNAVVLSDGDGDPVFYTGQGFGYIDGRYFVSARTFGASTDYNSLLKPGMFRVDNFATNAPTTSFHAVLVFGNGGNVTTQIAVPLQSTTVYVRSYNSGWTSWRTI
jgi:hypothetical protein